VNHPFVISVIMHIAFFVVMGLFAIRSRPEVMALPVQTVRWINIVPPVAPPVTEAAPAPPTKPVVRAPKTKVERGTAILPEKPAKLPETQQIPEPIPESTIAPPEPAPEVMAEPDTTATTIVAGLPDASGLKVDEPDFTFLYYLNIIRNRIQDYWQPPRLASSRSQNQQAMVMFKIGRSGKISQIRVEQSSGNFLFDQAAQRALYEVTQLPPLPVEYGGKELTVHIEFETLR
jgi:TonB family protein